MKNKIGVYSSQYSNFFGNNQIHFPYSIATLVSYCLADETVKDSFDFKRVFLFRDGVDEDIKKALEIEILLCSCYSWNWEITKYLAKSVKDINPKCLIIFGGPEIPRVHVDFFKEHDFVDIIVHGEGEVVLRNILKEYLNGPIDLANTQVKGIETKFKKTLPQERIEDLNIIPSPYSSDLIWELAEKKPEIKYIVSWETNRGCPFSCTYCDWGSSTMSKIRNFSEEKIFKEIEWFGENHITYIDCCDGNFGIFQERDYNIAQKLVESKTKTSFPERLNLTWVKTSSEKVIPTAKLLADAQMLRAVSLSVQSLDQKTLDAIKRKNLKFDKFEDLIKKFADVGIQSYTELIMGLPEETLESFKNNWEILANLQPQPAIMVWNCSVFVNAPMNDKNYISKYGIEVFTSPMFMQHSQKNENKIKEFEKMVRATNALPDGKLTEVYTFNWTMMVFHVFGITEFISRYYHINHSVAYARFYDLLLSFFKQDENSYFGSMFKTVHNHTKDGYSGKGWDYYNDEIGDISWPIEEASWLKLTRNKELLFEEVKKFILFLNQSLGISIKEEEVSDLILFQLFILSLAEERDKEGITQNFKYNWLEYFISTDTPLVKEDNSLYKFVKTRENDIIKWGYETIWFGRRSHKYKMKLKEITRIIDEK